MVKENPLIIVEDDKANIRIDVYLKDRFEDRTRSQFQKLIEDNHVTVNNVTVKSNYKVKSGDVISLNIPELKLLAIKAEDIELEVVFEDEAIAVINKPQGMVVHPAAGNYTGTLVNALLAHCDNLSGINGVIRPGIVHRIDKDTSGILVIAKNDAAHKGLATQISEHSMKRLYIAIVEGVIKVEAGTIDKPIGRHPTLRKQMAIVKNGRNAITHYTVLEQYKNHTLIEARLETGRTHQIRVHMASIGHPLVGDMKYGFKKQKFHLNGQALHAKLLGFVHPISGEYMEFTSQLPEYFINLINILRR